MIDVSVIYVNYRSAGLIMDSIRSVKEKTEGIACEIIVVDNASGDDSQSLICSAFPDVIYIQSAENLGFGRANNLGIEQAKGECFFFLNPDTLLLNNAIAILYKQLTETPKAGACGGNLFDERKQPAGSFSRIFPSFGWEIASIAYLSPFVFPSPRSKDFNYTRKPLAVASVTGADLMVKRSVWQETGGFDAAFFMNYEETEWCYRIRKKGYKIFSFPDAEIVHLEGRASGIKEARLSLLCEGQYIYFSKLYGGKKGAKRIYRITQWKNRLRILLFRLLRNRKKTDYWRMKREVNKKAFQHFERKEI
jgi:GT2 family glycosyltransferase